MLSGFKLLVKIFNLCLWLHLKSFISHCLFYALMMTYLHLKFCAVSYVNSALKVKDQSSSVNGTQQDKSGKHTKAGLKTGSDMHQVSLAQQVQQEETQSEVISEAEFQAMCSKLGEFKQLATTVGEELSAQDKAIDSLTEAVCHGDIRIQAANRKIKKLT